MSFNSFFFSILWDGELTLKGSAIFLGFSSHAAIEKKNSSLLAVRHLTGFLSWSEGLRFAVVCSIINSYFISAYLYLVNGENHVML